MQLKKYYQDQAAEAPWWWSVHVRTSRDAQEAYRAYQHRIEVGLQATRSVEELAEFLGPAERRLSDAMRRMEEVLTWEVSPRCIADQQQLAKLKHLENELRWASGGVSLCRLALDGDNQRGGESRPDDSTCQWTIV